MPKRERTCSGLKLWCSLDMKEPDVRTMGLPERMSLYLRRQLIAATRRQVPSPPVCMKKRGTNTAPSLTILGDKLGGDSCLKCGKNRAVVTGHDVTGAACRGRKEFLSRGGEILLVEPRMVNARQKSTDAYGTNFMVSYGCSITFHSHA